MDRLNLINRLKSSLESYFINSNNKEWINIDIVNVNRVDLTIVSEKGGNIKECEQYIDLVIKNLNDKIQNNYEKLYLGMIKIYTVDEAEFFEIVKPKKLKEKGFTFGELVDELGNDSFTLYNKNDKYTKSKIVSFYSYKGGVGRTVTLIQTAHLLADKGKKVAIIDLDIEAPSFNDVFEDDINGEKGIINYLYNKLYNIKSDENDSIAKFVSKLNVNSDGEVYVIPAGEISLKYIKMLELLKERRIYENQYITEFIMELEKQYNIDYVLIDSRTGLNNWGALSIADISDEVFLCAYPNKENVKGINLILSLIKGRKKCNVIFSRIDNSDKGIEKAKELFGEIDVEQEFIGILYDKRIALGNKYPIESINNGFYNISEYLLEDEVRKWNKRFIDLNPDVNNDVLNKISERENFENIYTSSEKKILDTSNLILIKEKDINVEELIRKIEDKYNYIKIDDFKVNFSKSLEINDNKELLDNLIDEIYINLLIKTSEKIYNDNLVEEKILSYLKSNNLKSSNEETFSKSLMYTCGKDLVNFMEDTSDVYYCIINCEEVLKQCSGLDTRLGREVYLKIWLLVINHLNVLQKKVVYKFIIDIENTEDIELIKEDYSANILDLTWKNKSDDFISENIEDVLNKIVQNLNNKKLMTAINENIFTEKNKLNNIVSTLNGDFMFSEKYLNQKRGIVFANRIDSSRYSETLIKWLSKEMKKSNRIGKKILLDIISEAANEEKDKHKEKYSIITFESIKEATNKLIY